MSELRAAEDHLASLENLRRSLRRLSRSAARAARGIRSEMHRASRARADARRTRFLLDMIDGWLPGAYRFLVSRGGRRIRSRRLIKKFYRRARAAWTIAIAGDPGLAREYEAFLRRREILRYNEDLVAMRRELDSRKEELSGLLRPGALG